MEDSRATPFSLPPGCRFRPSEEELLRRYLAGKNGGGSEGICGVIGEVDLYGHDPFELPESACFAYGSGGKRRHWYCYAGSGGLRGAKRTAKGGFWRRKGRPKVVLGSGGTGGLGSRTAFVFYSVNSAKTAVKTDWILYEYSSIDHVQASFVLCRVFTKTRPRNAISENGLVSCAEESISAVRHIGIQHDGDECSIRKDDSEINYQNMTKSDPFLNFEFPMYLDCNAEMNMDNFTAQHLLSIREEDYLEYNDLVD